MDHCEQCGFDYYQLGTDEVPGAIRSLESGYRARLETGFRDPERQRLLRTRPRPDVWSALEYCCHVRDVLLALRERLYLALSEDTPRFSSMHRDQRVALARYNEDGVEEVAREIELAANLFARGLGRLDGAQWDRRCIYPYPAPAQRTVAWLARHTVHEGRHHLQDVDDVISEVSSAR